MHDKLHFLSRAGHSRVLLLLGISVLLPGITAQDWKWVGNSSTLYAPRVTNVNFLLTIYTHHEEERLMITKGRCTDLFFFVKFSQLISSGKYMGLRQCSPYQAETGKIYRLKQHFVPPVTARRVTMSRGLKIPFLYSHKVSTWFCYFCLFLFSNRLHYRVFYSLYLYENAFEATCASINSVFDQNFTGQQSIMRYRYAKLYCTFHKLGNSKVQKPPSQLHFSLLSIIITITSNEPWNTENHKSQTMTFWTH